MKISYLKLEALDQLKKDAPHIIDKYQSNESWLNNYFGNSNHSLQSKMDFDKIDLKKPDENNNYDIANTIAFFSAFKNLRVDQASDERLWTHMCHTDYWDYMRSRWPVEKVTEEADTEVGQEENKKSPVDRIRERYFFQSNRGRAIVRNGLARLWWYGYMTYDEKRSDPFELTKVLLRRHDDAQSLLERSFPHNKVILHSILQVLSEHEYVSRDAFRGLMKSLNRIGGVTILDTLNMEEMVILVRNKLNEILAKKK